LLPLHSATADPGTVKVYIYSSKAWSVDALKGQAVGVEIENAVGCNSIHDAGVLNDLSTRLGLLQAKGPNWFPRIIFQNSCRVREAFDFYHSKYPVKFLFSVLICPS